MSSNGRPNNWSVDAVAAISAQVLGSSPAMGMASQYQSFAQASGLAALNAVSGQQNMYMLHRAAATRDIAAALPRRAPRAAPDHSGLALAILGLALALNKG
ncbi:MAG TPA: RebB family R body protein [Skermanella sp.]|jgi:hypothetical protein|nr:RebB family R body protein [Skermanella sp.]